MAIIQNIALCLLYRASSESRLLEWSKIPTKKIGKNQKLIHIIHMKFEKQSLQQNDKKEERGTVNRNILYILLLNPLHSILQRFLRLIISTN